jgi:cell wall-associated NlpC family hydrolase
MIIEIAKQEIGYAEGANNDTKYGKWYGLNNNPWCAMFVSWVYDQAGLVKHIAASSKKGFASCAAGLAWFTKKNKLVPIGQAQPGDIAFFQFDNDAEPDHVGIVVKNNTRRKILVCIEGNTSSGKVGSQANGDGVYQRKRPYNYVLAVARPVKEKNETATSTSA